MGGLTGNPLLRDVSKCRANFTRALRADRIHPERNENRARPQAEPQRDIAGMKACRRMGT
jgi:hypothetical protein